MSVAYRPGKLAQAYKQLPRRERDEVNKLTNEIFASRTKVYRKLDPKRDRALCDVWLQIRDEVMSGEHRPLHGVVTHVSRMTSSIGEYASSTIDGIYESMKSGNDNNDAPWMKIAWEQHDKGVIEIPGKKHNEDIMKYIRSCPDLYASANKTTYTEREGEEGVKWCSAFVNWCMKQAGYPGTDSARALSWTDYGEALSEPKAGAIVVTKGSKYRHVAFVEEVNGEFKSLGGNQKGKIKQVNGKDDYNQVSLSNINTKLVVAYRWPKAI